MCVALNRARPGGGVCVASPRSRVRAENFLHRARAIAAWPVAGNAAGADTGCTVCRSRGAVVRRGVGRTAAADPTPRRSNGSLLYTTPLALFLRIALKPVRVQALPQAQACAGQDDPEIIGRNYVEFLANGLAVEAVELAQQQGVGEASGQVLDAVCEDAPELMLFERAVRLAPRRDIDAPVAVLVEEAVEMIGEFVAGRHRAARLAQVVDDLVFHDADEPGAFGRRARV